MPEAHSWPASAVEAAALSSCAVDKLRIQVVPPASREELSRSCSSNQVRCQNTTTKRTCSPQPAETLASSRNRLFRRLCPLSFVLWPFTTACARARSAKPVGRRRRASDALKQRTPRRLGRRRPLSAAAQHHLQWCLQKWSWMPLRSCRPRVYPAPSDAPAQGYARRAPLHAQALRR